jgi:hypothetical protein
MDIQSAFNPTIQRGSSYIYLLESAEDKTACNGFPAINFYDYNTSCRGYGLADFFAALSRHEGRGTGSKQNGHQAQLELAASSTSGDAHRLVEGVFDANANATRGLAVNAAATIALVLIDRWTDHNVVRDNWCEGHLWEYDRGEKKFFYVAVPEIRTDPCL